jgi:hypothetical protein
MVSINACRYTVFGIFVIFNAIICSVSAWNLGILKSIGLFPTVDGFLIFLGILGILLIFPIICIEQTRKNALPSRVWFEVLWVSVFWIFNLSGAAATSALLPDLFCEMAESGWTLDRCTSTKVLVGFLWLSTVMHLAYLMILVIAAIIHAREHPDVWQAGVPDFPWFPKDQGLKRISSQPSDIESQMPKGFRPLYTSKTAFTAEFPHLHPQTPSHQSYPSEKDLPTLYKAPKAPASNNYPRQAPKTSYARQATYDAPLPPVPRSQPPAQYPAILGPGIPARPRPARAPTAPLFKVPPPMTPTKREGTPTHAVSPSWPAPRPPPPAIIQAAPAGRRTRSGSGSVQRHRPPPLDLTGISNA